MKKNKRTLYECFNAKVSGKDIYCEEGYALGKGEGSLDQSRLEQGEKLAPKICQQCAEFDSMGPPVPADEKGWYKLKGAN
jgi:hypothetical protein